MVTLRPASQRGRTQIGWLDSRHSFSFGDYHDAGQMGFRSLRVINDDRVAPGSGFGTHGHRDMEIITYVLDGELEHRDSLGTGDVLSRGDVQRMTAGTGIRHSEFNPSKSHPVHFLQIWVLPERPGLAPAYEQKSFPEADKRGRLQSIVSPDGHDGAMTIQQDVELFATVLETNESVSHELREGRSGWVQVARGQVELNGQSLGEGDGAAVVNEQRIELKGRDDAEVLLFDLA
ncbi:MAG TPA: pirin family protein [Planctomycetaceae bacterium]|jgi:redox-sensitive bicupin YhaK (pirin superfamily)|nr:pirin family protein [Planctomycetaceae bacterium]